MTTEIDTRDKIKVAARKLFAERGVEAVTVREIVAEAGARNGGSLNYYFESKEGLITELLNETLRRSSEGWLEGIAKLERNGGAKSVRDVIHVIVYGPAVYAPKGPESTAYRFMASVLFTRRRMVREMMKKLDYSVFLRLLGYVQQVRSDIPAPVMRQRLIFLAWYLISVLSAHEAYIAARRTSKEWTDIDPLENIIDTATAMIEAPWSLGKAAAPRRARGGKGATAGANVAPPA